MKRVETQLPGCGFGRISRRTNIRQLSICPRCNCMTWTMMDDDGNRYCGKCKERKDK